MSKVITKIEEQDLIDRIKQIEIEELPRHRSLAQRAREEGDLSENTAYDSALSAIKSLEKELRELQTELRLSIVIDKEEMDGIGIGHTFEVRILAGNKETFSGTVLMVGEGNGNPFTNPPRISKSSDLGKIVYGKREGEPKVINKDGVECVIKFKKNEG